MIKVVLIEDDLDFCFLIQDTLKKTQDIELIGVFHEPQSALKEGIPLDPDIILADLNLTSNALDGIDVIKEFRLATKCKSIILSSFEEPHIVIEASKKSFSSAYIFKSQFHLLCATIRDCYYGQTPQEDFIKNIIISQLSNAELSVLKMIINHEPLLNSSTKTIANQKTSILKKFGLKSQKELIHIFSHYD